MSQRKHLTLLVAFVLCCVSAYPQADRSHVVIRVVDDAGKPAPNVHLGIESSITGTRSIAEAGDTDADGVSHFDVPKAGLYTISIVRPQTFYRPSTICRAYFKYPLPPVLKITWHPSAPDAEPPIVPPECSVEPPSQAGSGEPTPKPEDMTSLPNPTQGPTQGPEEPGWIVQLLLAVLPLIAFFALREITVRLVAARMMRKAPKILSSSTTAQIATSTSPGAAPSGDGGRPQVNFLEVNSTSEVALTLPAKDRWKRSLKMGSRRLLVFLLSLWLQVGLTELLLWRSGDILGGILFAILAALAALYLTGVAFSSWLNTGNLETVVVALSVLTQAAIAIVLTINVSWYAILPAVIGVACLVFGIRRLEQPVKADGNKRLLILRVFGSDKNAAYTFGTLMNKWRFIGTFSTIVDPSYVRFQFAAFSPGNRRRSVGITLLYGMAASLVPVLTSNFETALPSWVTERSFAQIQKVAPLLLVPLAILPILLYIRRRFIINAAQFDAEIDGTMQTRLLPGISGIFRGLAMFCFDDIWKPAVGHMLKCADVVLMDLRGFLPERKGCAYEIGELIDHFPISRLLFLIDEKCDKQELYKLVRDRWQTMSPNSPNQAVAEPSIKVYIAHQHKKKDIAKILAMLSANVEAVAPMQQSSAAQSA